MGSADKSYICLSRLWLMIKGEALKLRFLITLWFVTLLACYAEEADLHFHKITTSLGLSHNTVYSIVQDRKGFIWFGTREGLNRFDGHEVISYYSNPEDSFSLTSNHITSLQQEDREGLC